VNLSLNSDLLRLGRGYGLNLSALAEAALAQAVQAAQEEAWLRENAEAIRAYNEHVGQRGVFSDGWRGF
jgi:antitoxin CcdA